MDSTSLGGTPSRRLRTPSNASVTSSASRLSRPGASWRGVMLHLQYIISRGGRCGTFSAVLNEMYVQRGRTHGASSMGVGVVIDPLPLEVATSLFPHSPSARSIRSAFRPYSGCSDNAE